MGEESNHFYGFGPYKLDPVKRLLFKDGEPIALTPKAFDTLVVLVQGGGQLIEKEDLMKRVWPNSFVEDGNLTVNISMLRKVLGESPNHHRYIVTVPGRGYRFVADVREVSGKADDLIVEEHTRSHVIIEQEEEVKKEEEVSGQQEAAPNSLHTSVAAPGDQRLRWKVLFTLALIFGLIAIVTIQKYSSRSRKQYGSALLSSLRIVQLSNWESEPGEFASDAKFSPDGNMIAFSSNKNGYSNIWIKQIAGGEPIQVTKNESNNWSPIWSSNGQKIAFVSSNGSYTSIFSIPAFGKTSTLLQTLEACKPTLRSWSKDGATIYYELNSNLFALDVASKQATQKTHFDTAKSYPRDFSISPGEDRIAYVDRKQGQTDIWVASTEGEGGVQITNDAAEDQNPLWHPDGRVIYSSNVSGIYQICITYKDAPGPTQLTFVNSDCVASDVSKDKILFLSSKEESDVWEAKVDTIQEVQLTYDIGSEFWPDISYDGKRVAFQAINTPSIAGELPNSALLNKPVKGEGQQTELARDGFYPKWSPDGSKLAFLRISGSQINIWTVRATGGDEKQLTTGGVWFGGYSILPYNRRMTRDYCWSPDGSKILYCSNKNNQNNIRTISAEGSNETDILTNPDPDLIYYCPIWSPDFKRIAFVSQQVKPPSNGKVIRSLCLTEGGKSKTILQSDSLLRLVGWTQPGGDLIVGLVEGKDKFQAKTTDITLLRVSTAGDRQVIAQLDSAYLSSIEMSPEGRAVAFVAQRDGKDNIWLLSINEGDQKRITGNTDIRIHFSSVIWSRDGSKLFYDKQEKRSLVSMIENFN